MKIEEYFKNEKKLNETINKFIKLKTIFKEDINKNITLAHLEKTQHNLEFYHKNKEDKTYYDWLIVILYYALYHSALALISNKNYRSKNHLGTILILIKEYKLNEEEIKLIEELRITTEDAKLYSNLKEERHRASYATKTLFDKKEIKEYEIKVKKFFAKAKKLIEK